MMKQRMALIGGSLVLVGLVAPNLGCSQGGDRSEEEDVAATDAMSAEDSLLDFDVPPNPTKQVSPEYPKDANGPAEGMVWVEVAIDENGHVTEAHVDSSDAIPALESAAVEAAIQWEFEPAQRNQAPVKSKIVIPFKFELH
jgi:TonB family protein